MFARVIVDISNDAVDRIFDYRALSDTKIGMRVLVPFGGRKVMGYVVALTNQTDFDETKVKSIIANLENEPKLRPEILELSFYLARHFFLRLSDCIKLVLPSCVRNFSQHEQTEFILSNVYDIETSINMIGNRAKNQLSAVAYLNEHEESIFFNVLAKESVNNENN